MNARDNMAKHEHAKAEESCFNMDLHYTFVSMGWCKKDLTPVR